MSKNILNLLLLGLIISFILIQNDMRIYSHHQPSFTAKPVGCWNEYSESILTNWLSKSHSVTYHIAQEYWIKDNTCGIETATETHTVTRGTTESFIHTKGASVSLGSALSVGDGTWTELSIQSTQTLSEGWRVGIGQVYQIQSALTANVPPNQEHRYDWYIDKWTGNGHRHVYRAWSGYWTAISTEGCAALWYYKSGNDSFDSSDASGVEYHNLTATGPQITNTTCP